MAVYVIVVTLAVVGLVAAYRVFGGGQASSPDSATLLATAAESLQRSLDELATVTADTGVPGGVGIDPVSAGRRALAVAQRCLDLLPGDGGLDADRQAARALLSNSVDDLGWAWRIVASATSTDSQGLSAAVNALRGHAARCVERASQLLLAPSPEPVEGA